MHIKRKGRQHFLAYKVPDAMKFLSPRFWDSPVLSVLTKGWLGENLNGLSPNKILPLKEEGPPIGILLLHSIRLNHMKKNCNLQAIYSIVHTEV